MDFIGDFQPRWHRFVRVRVEVDISTPLKPGMFLPRKDLNDIWIGLKYEKMLNICYNCGTIGHEPSNCKAKRVLITNPFGDKFQAYGS